MKNSVDILKPKWENSVDIHKTDEEKNIIDILKFGKEKQ